MEPRCAVHPDRPAAVTCQRCGAFACEEDSRLVADQALCAACAARPDADYLEQFRLRHWGKRDGFAWFWGATSLLYLAWAASAAASDQPLSAAIGLVLGAAGIAYFLGPRWARRLVFLFPAAVMGWTVANAAALRTSPAGAMNVAVALTAGGIFALAPFLLALLVSIDGRNQLFFRVPVTRAKLERTWQRHANNSAARNGLLLSLTGLLIPAVSLPGLALSIAGLSRVDPDARPPIGRKKQALAGIILGALGALGWGTYLASMMWGAWS